jgi:hypothetical protein
MSWKAAVGAAAVVCALAMPGPAGPARAESPELGNDQILRNLTNVVFGSEFVGEDSSYVRKWVGPMRVAVYGDDDGRYSDLIDRHLDTLRQLTGLDIVRVPHSDPESNAHISFLSRSQFRSYAQAYLSKGKPGTNTNLACFGVFKTNGERDIVEYYAMIPRSSSREEVDACIVEEVTQVLGLPNDSFDIRPSIFNDDDEYHQLTWQDRLMVEVLYDPRITPGMGHDEFVTVARGVIDQLHPQDGSPVVAAPVAPPQPQASVKPASYPIVETPRLTRDRALPQ